MIWEDCLAEWVLRGAQVKGGHLDPSRSSFVPIAATEGYSLDADGYNDEIWALFSFVSEGNIFFA